MSTSPQKQTASKPQLCVVMPVYNEEDAIGPVLEKWDAALKSLGIEYEIRPYNDESKDNSLAVMREASQHLGPQINVRNKQNGGHGNTILTGYREAAADGFEWVFQIDSDDEMGPERFRDLWEKRKNFDFLVGIRDGRKQALPRRIISLVSRVCVRCFFGNGVWDVNTPYRLMRVSKFSEFYRQIPLMTFAPNVILSGLAARHGLRCYETPVPQHDRTTGEVSIKKWKLAKAAIKSFIQLIAFALRAPDITVVRRDRSLWLKLGLGWISAITFFAWLPDTFYNWGYNYLSFLPVLFTAITAAICTLILAGPLDRWAPGFLKAPVVTAGIKLLLLCSLPILFWVLRTKIHCFSGDGCVGNVPSDLTVRLSDFIPAPPGKGRLDCWGMGPLTKVLMQCGILQSFTGMTSHFASQIYSVVTGGVYVALVLALFWKYTVAICVLLTLPCVFNFFGNIDCYTFSLCIAVIFAYALTACETRGDDIGFRRLACASLMWLVGMWTHPFFVFGGLLLIPPAVRYVNRLQKRILFRPMPFQILFAVILFVAICHSEHARPFFTWTLGQRLPVFSKYTLIHLLNVMLLPAAPLALAVWMSCGNRKDKISATVVFALMCACFLPLGFTQGANDQFPYMHLSFFFMLPWLTQLARCAPSRSCCRFIIAANLFLLIPLIAVHSSDLTVARAERLYPIDPCKHNTEMSWQTHLGLLLGDNIIDSKAVKSATLRTFQNGARNANPPGFRGSNYLYYTAFLYHFGEFEKGKECLFGILKQNPNLFRNFLGVRPCFIYCNRQRLWDDLELYLRKANHPQINEFLKIKEVLIRKAHDEPFYIRRPAYAVTEV